MPRTARAIVGGNWYHLINRGNNRMRIFHDQSDYEHFMSLVADIHNRIPLATLAACLMPNHIHFLLLPQNSSDLADWTHRLFTTHARRYHKKYGTTGRVWQGRYKAFLIQHGEHLLKVMRYVERNALRANLVDRAENWRWGSLHWRYDKRAGGLPLYPIALPADWTESVNEAQTAAELDAIRQSVNRQCPYGDQDWVASKARELGLGQTLAPLGRPRKNELERK